MSESVRCPNCNSTQLTPQKRGLSGGKALAAAVLADRVGLLAFMYGSNSTVLVCQACGKKWNPAKQAAWSQPTTVINSHAVTRQRIENSEVWRRNFLELYQMGQHDEAAELLKQEHPMLYQNLGLDGAFVSIKRKMSSHTNGERVGFLLVALIIAIMVILVIKSSHL